MFKRSPQTHTHTDGMVNLLSSLNRVKYCGVFAPCKNCWATETSKHASSNRITSVYTSLLGDGQNANELTQVGVTWLFLSVIFLTQQQEPPETFCLRLVLTISGIGFSVVSAWRLYNATLVLFQTKAIMLFFFMFVSLITLALVLSSLLCTDRG
jgi:hypothetical protein